MSWSVTIRNVQQAEVLPLHVQMKAAATHPAYAYDMNHALALAKALGLESATLTGMRAPNPYGGKEVIDVSVRGTVEGDFITNIRNAILAGPSQDSATFQHYLAIDWLRNHPCSHNFEPVESSPGSARCSQCSVYLERGLLRYE